MREEYYQGPEEVKQVIPIDKISCCRAPPLGVSLSRLLSTIFVKTLPSQEVLPVSPVGRQMKWPKKALTVGFGSIFVHIVNTCTDTTKNYLKPNTLYSASYRRTFIFFFVVFVFVFLS